MNLQHQVHLHVWGICRKEVQTQPCCLNQYLQHTSPSPVVRNTTKINYSCTAQKSQNYRILGWVGLERPLKVSPWAGTPRKKGCGKVPAMAHCKEKLG